METCLKRREKQACRDKVCINSLRDTEWRRTTTARKIGQARSLNVGPNHPAYFGDRILRAARKVRESRRSDVDAEITIEGPRCDSFDYRPPISIDLDPSETELQR